MHKLTHINKNPIEYKRNEISLLQYVNYPILVAELQCRLQNDQSCCTLRHICLVFCPFDSNCHSSYGRMKNSVEIELIYVHKSLKGEGYCVHFEIMYIPGAQLREWRESSYASTR